ncbi:MAG: hypothetical protein M0R69_06815 [Candidatus Cloacimonetes bacterium]|jgi:hypothetical protein|nr:hypothetical protein [Candidatus Cloacimonadota bacterium]MCK9584604.1 hypothetical protein [Candidatus Cloacimonadota bacterium]
MKKLLLLATLSSIIVVALFCDSSEDFLLGNYSYWQGKDRATAKYATAADSVFQYMVECGYNSTICNAYLYEDTFTGAMLDKMGSGSVGLKAILTDFGWDGLQTDDFYGTRGLSLSN